MDFQQWDEWLRRYVDERGRVHYLAWQTAAADDLQRWLDSIVPAAIAGCSRDARLAFWLNLYNALTIAEILKVYPIVSIQPQVLGIPNWLAFLSFFTRPVLQRSDQSYSLNCIEHQIIRPQFQDPRVHFALVCASVGCPLLRSGAYFPDQVQQQLEDDAIRFINNPEKVRYDATRQVLFCSKIFKWYRRDFLSVAPSLQAYIGKYWGLIAPTQSNARAHSATVGEAIAPHATLRFLPYDWQLNGR